MMKTFIDEQGTFEIKIPISWRHLISENKVHTFQEYEIWKSDTFQLSITELSTEQKSNFVVRTKSLQKTKIGVQNYFTYPDIRDKEFTTKMWTRLFGNSVVRFTLTYSNDPHADLDSRSLADKMHAVYSVIKAFKLIDQQNKNAEIRAYRLDTFLQGVGATALILNMAIENKAFIEATSILANQIDALLRIGIVLKSQINNNNHEIKIEWIYQGLNNQKKSEKDIYKKALELGIINEVIVDQLYKLCDDRNRVIHRFIISEITLLKLKK